MIILLTIYILLNLILYISFKVNGRTSESVALIKTFSIFIVLPILKSPFLLQNYITVFILCEWVMGTSTIYYIVNFDRFMSKYLSTYSTIRFDRIIWPCKNEMKLLSEYNKRFLYSSTKYKEILNKYNYYSHLNKENEKMKLKDNLNFIFYRNWFYWYNFAKWIKKSI